MTNHYQINNGRPRRQSPRTSTSHRRPGQVRRRSPPPFPRTLFCATQLGNNYILHGGRRYKLRGTRRQRRRRTKRLTYTKRTYGNFRARTTRRPLFSHNSSNTTNLLSAIKNQRPRSVPNVTHLRRPKQRNHIRLNTTRGYRRMSHTHRLHHHYNDHHANRPRKPRRGGIRRGIRRTNHRGSLRQHFKVTTTRSALFTRVVKRRG